MFTVILLVYCLLSELPAIDQKDPSCQILWLVGAILLDFAINPIYDSRDPRKPVEIEFSSATDQ